MLRVGSQREERAISRALRNPEEYPRPPLMVTVGTGARRTNYRRVVKSATVSHSDGQIEASVDLGVRVSRERSNAPMRAWTRVAGVDIPLFKGTCYPAWGKRTSTLIGKSYGEMWERISFGGNTRTTYGGILPSSLHRQLAERLPYDPSRIEIRQVPAPPINRLGDDGFAPEAKLEDGREAAEGEGGTVRFDTALGGYEVMPSPGLGGGKHPRFSYDVQNEVLEGSWDYSPAREQYRSVVVFRLNEDGTFAIRQTANVDWSAFPYPPRVGITLYQTISDTSASAATYAKNLARTLAAEAGLGIFSFSGVEVPFEPRYEPYDEGYFVERYEDEDGMWEERWLAILDSVEHVFEGSRHTRLSGWMRSVERKPIPEKVEPPEVKSSQVVRASLMPSEFLFPSETLLPNS